MAVALKFYRMLHGPASPRVRPLPLYSILVTDEDRKILLAIAQRKLERDDACDPCHGRGLLNGEVCTECLGQGVPLYEEEHNVLLCLSGRLTDDILDAEIIE
jgi:hypothetical protein